MLKNFIVGKIGKADIHYKFFMALEKCLKVAELDIFKFFEEKKNDKFRSILGPAKNIPG